MNLKHLFFTGLLMLSIIVSGCSSSAEQAATMTAVAWTPTPTPQDDAGTGTDASCEYDPLVMVGYGEVNGSLSLDDYEDCYGFLYASGDILEISIKASAGLNLSPTELQAPGGHPAPVRKIDETTYSISYAQDLGYRDYDRTFRIYIGTTFLAEGGNYTLTISSIPQNDAETGQDVVGGGHMTQLNSGEYSGFVGHDDECDEYFYGPLVVGSTLNVIATPDPGLDVSLRWSSVREVSGPNPILRYFEFDIPNEMNNIGSGGVETMAFLVDETQAYVASAFGDGIINHSFNVCRQEGTAGQYMLNVSVK